MEYKNNQTYEKIVKKKCKNNLFDNYNINIFNEKILNFNNYNKGAGVIFANGIQK